MTEQDQNGKGARAGIFGRSKHLVIFWFVLWPLLSVAVGAYYTVNEPNTHGVPLGIAFVGVLVGVVYLLPEFLIAAAILLFFSWGVFRLFPPSEEERVRRWMFEPAIAFLGITLGISFEYPTVLSSPLLAPVHPLSLLSGWVVIAAFLLLLAGLRNGLHQGRIATVIVPVVAFVALGWGLSQLPVGGQEKTANRGATVILGVDSLGFNTDIAHLRTFAQQNGGAFYEKAVTPGLLTNVVWTAIIQHRPAHENGTILLTQNPDWSRSPFQMVSEAKRRGYQTWSYITSQNSTYVGSLAGFEYDRSGPMGWLYNATVGAKNGSVLVSFVVSRLPRIPFLRICQNQSGTYAYDLRADVHNILNSHRGPRPVFTVGHLEYLHEDAYPRLHDLPASARYTLLSAPIDSLRDAGSDPQIFPLDGDRIDLVNWKHQNVQHVITEEIQKSGFLAAQNHNRLVILADHGVRTGINNDNFADEKYYRVPLITFGVPTRDVTKPISLLDVSSIVGIDDPSSPGPADPAVEFAVWATHVQYAEDTRSAEWTVDGRVNLSRSVVNKYRSQLKIYDPYGLRSIGNIGETSVSQTSPAGEHEQPGQVTGIAGDRPSPPANPEGNIPHPPVL